MTDLTAQQFARLLAHIEHFGADHRAEICARLGTDEAAYLRAAKNVPGELTREAAAGQLGPIHAFGDTFKATKADLESKKPALDSLGTVPRAARAVVAAPGVATSGETTLDPVSARTRGPALPFQPGVAKPPAPLPAAASAPADRSGETIALGGEQGAAAATPFEERELAQWTVERYAAFMADRRAGDIDAVRSEYGIHDDGFEALLLAHFNKQFGRDPSLRTRWLALMVERTRQQKGGG